MPGMWFALAALWIALALTVLDGAAWALIVGGLCALAGLLFGLAQIPRNRT